MAVDTSEGHEAMDYEEHVRTYQRFVKVSAWLTGAAALILILLAGFVA